MTRRQGCGALLAAAATWMVAVSTAHAWVQDAPKAETAPSREAWDAVYIAGKKVGSIHTRVEPVEARDGRKLLRVQVTTRLSFKRLNDLVDVQMRFGTIETPEGEVLRLDSRTRTGNSELRTYGDAADGKMTLTLEGSGQRKSLEIDWPSDVRGPYAPELSLARKPIGEGEERTIKTFIPDLNVIGQTKLTAKGQETVELGGGSYSLLRVDSQVTDAEGKPLPGMDSSYWVDSGGQVLKSSTDVFGGLVTYRTTQEAAEADAGSKFDLVSASIVRIPRRINNASSVRSATYRASIEGGDPTKVFPSDGRQVVTAEGPGVATLAVRTVSPTDAPTGPTEVDPAYLRANPLINSEDPAVVALTRQATAGKSDPWSKAAAIGQWVADNIRDKNFEVAFATASEVARDRAGDCSEHSVLTAAMCRAAGIPSRVAIGLVYAENLNGFGYHMWNEVFVNGRWVPIDSTFKQTEVDATHLKLNDSSLDGVSPYGTFLDVVKVFSKLKLEAIDVR